MYTDNYGLLLIIIIIINLLIHNVHITYIKLIIHVWS
jgi:hypothetical protein